MTSTLASLAVAVVVIGFAATANGQDRAPAPVLDRSQATTAAPPGSEEKTETRKVETQDQVPAPATPPESEEKTAAPKVETPDQAPAPEGTAALPESQDKTAAPKVETPDPAPAPEGTAALPESQDKTAAPKVETPDPAPEGTAALPESQDKTTVPKVETPDQAPSPKGAAALPESPEKAPAPKLESPDKAPAVVPSEIVVYASDLSERALFEFEFWPSPGSPGGKMVGTIQTGDEMHPPPEEDPHITFKVKVVGGVPYRCWIRMLVGEPLGLSQANRLYVQFSHAVDNGGKDVFKTHTASYLTVQGPLRRGWRWVACEAGAKGAESLIYFRESREVTVKVQAGMEGVGWDQFVLSPARFLEKPPAEAVVKK